MFELEISPGFFAKFDDCDHELVNSRKWHMSRTKRDREMGHSGYVVWYSWVPYLNRSRTTTFQKLIFPPPEGMQIDHINGDKIDNRRENLRHITQGENARSFNRTRPNKSSKYRGVCVNPKSARNPWIAQIGFMVDGETKVIYIGSFPMQEAAALAYNKRAIELGFSPEALNKIEA